MTTVSFPKVSPFRRAGLALAFLAGLPAVVMAAAESRSGAEAAAPAAVSGTVAMLTAAPRAAASEGATLASTAGLSTLSELIHAGGWTMYVIVAMSVVALALTVYYLLSLRPSVLYPHALLHKLEIAAAEGDVQLLRDLCVGSDAAAAQVLLGGLEQLEMDNRLDYTVIMAAMEDEGSRQASMLWQRIQYLLDVAVVAPMVGLLGTVLGMLQAFGNLQAEIGSVIPTNLAHGVAKALITTAGGLVVGIPAMLLYGLFRGRVMSLVTGMETACGRIMRRLCMSLKQPAAGEQAKAKAKG